MNAQFRGTWDVAPRSHPNDGRLDVVRVNRTTTIRDRFQARARISHGTHVPHPQIETRQVKSIDLQFIRPLAVVLDGVRWRTTQQVTLTVEPDALDVLF